jgi:FkbM family methyltransferase
LEDVLLWRARQHVPKGFYVDVGALSPDEDSVTKAFYERGWHGLNIEPNPELMEAFRIERPRDINVNVAVGDHGGDAWLHVVSNAGLSTVDPDVATLREHDGYSVLRQPTHLQTLASVWAQHVPEGQAVHFLKVDVEGLERQVVLGNDWDRNRPWVTVVEATRPMSPDASYADWEPVLLDARYTFAYADGLNRFYVSQEHAELRDLLAMPPNVFDHFVRRSEVRRLERAERRADVAEARLRHLHGSLSWRLTSPLRRASAVLRRH